MVLFTMQLRICRAVPRTSTIALNNATLPYAQLLASKGYREAFKANHALSLGLNTYKGHVTHKGVAEAFGLEYTSVEDAFKRRLIIDLI